MFAARELLACATQTTAHSTATRVASPQFRFRVRTFTTVSPLIRDGEIDVARRRAPTCSPSALTTPFGRESCASADRPRRRCSGQPIAHGYPFTEPAVSPEAMYRCATTSI